MCLYDYMKFSEGGEAHAALFTIIPLNYTIIMLFVIHIGSMLDTMIIIIFLINMVSAAWLRLHLSQPLSYCHPLHLLIADTNRQLRLSLISVLP